MTNRYTTHLRFPIPAFDTPSWQEAFETAIDNIDTAIFNTMVANSAGAWDNDTAYTVGDIAIDDADNTLWICGVSHTSDSAPTTFAEDRTANPTYWNTLTIALSPRGEWANDTAYAYLDIVQDTALGVVAICTTAHTSSSSPATINTDSANWQFLIDVQDADFIATLYAALTPALLTTGSANAYLLTAALVPALVDGATLHVKASFTNTGASTLGLNALTVKAIRKQSTTTDVALTGGEIQASGEYTLRYRTAANGGAGAFILLNPTFLNADNTFTGAQTFNNQNVTVTWSDDGAGVGPNININRISASPAASDVLGATLFNGKDSGGNTTEYGAIQAKILDPTDASEDGQLELKTMLAGTAAVRAYLAAGFVVGSPTGGDEGAGTINATGMYINGQSIVPAGELWGLTLSNNGSDATNDIDIAAGQAVDSTNAVRMILASALTKRLDADWSAGTGNGMRYSGAAIANTTYHIHLVMSTAGVVDIYADPSASVATALGHLQAETGGSAYSWMRRIGSIIRAGGTILAFTQTGDLFELSTPVLDVDVSTLGTSSTTYALASVPTGIVVSALMNLRGSAASAGGLYARPLTAADVAASATAAPLVTVFWSAGASAFAARLQIATDTSAQIAARSTQASTGLKIATLGWVDTRGRLA